MSQDPADHRGARTDGTAVPSPVVDALRTAQRVLLLAHLYPDGDVLGSQLGLGLALRTGGRAVTFACHHAVPETFHFLPGATEVQQWKEGTGGHDLVTRWIPRTPDGSAASSTAAGPLGPVSSTSTTTPTIGATGT